MSDKVYKGPYKLDECKLLLNVVFTFLLGYLEGPILDLSTPQKSSIPISQILLVGDKAYLEFKNIGKQDGFET
jgi:hypothetical protein